MPYWEYRNRKGGKNFVKLSKFPNIVQLKKQNKTKPEKFTKSRWLVKMLFMYMEIYEKGMSF